MNVRIILGGTLLALMMGSTDAHHSFAAHYDGNKTVEITGVVVDFRLISPHTSIIVDVTKEDGSVERWTVETNSASNVRRLGWDENTFKPGDLITVSGAPHRRSVSQMHGNEFTTPKGTLERPPQEALVQAYPPDPDARGLVGRWLPKPFPPAPTDGPRLPVTAEGLEAWKTYNAALSPLAACDEPMNIPTLYAAPYVLDIRLNDQEVVFDYEIYDIVHTVPLSAAPKLQEPSGRFGVAAGRMEGDELVVESSGFPPSKWGLGVEAIEGGDIPSSAKKKVTTRYSVSEDGKTLSIDYTLEDPVYLREPHSEYREWTRVADDAPIRYGYHCDPDSAALFTGREIREE